MDGWWIALTAALAIFAGWLLLKLVLLRRALRETAEELEEKLEVLRAALETENADKIRAALHRVVPTFREPDEVNAAQGDTVELPARAIRSL